MGKVIKRVVVEFEFNSETEENPYIKDWWLKNQVGQAIGYSMPLINSRITGVTVLAKKVTILPDEITINLSDALCQ